MNERRYSDDQATERLLVMGFEQGPTTKRLTRFHWPHTPAAQGSLYLLFSKAQKGVVIKVHPEVDVTDLPSGCVVEGDYYNHSLCDFPRVVLDPKKPKTRHGVSVFVLNQEGLEALAAQVMKAGTSADPSDPQTCGVDCQEACAGKCEVDCDCEVMPQAQPCCRDEACECDASSVPAHVTLEDPKRESCACSQREQNPSPSAQTECCGFWRWIKRLFGG